MIRKRVRWAASAYGRNISSLREDILKRSLPEGTWERGDAPKSTTYTS